MKSSALFNALPSHETLSILRSSSITNLVLPNHQTPIAIRGARIRHPMSSSLPSDVKSNTTEQQQAEKQTSEKTTTTTKTKKKEAPSPPEKPEAGDCCGSGCVRCVWDVYYDELDEYDRLRKEFDSSPNESPEH